MATSRATPSNAVLCRRNNLATAVLLNACSHLAKSLSHLCPLFVGSIGVTSVLTRAHVSTRRSCLNQLSSMRRLTASKHLQRHRSLWRRKQAVEFSQRADIQRVRQGVQVFG